MCSRTVEAGWTKERCSRREGLADITSDKVFVAFGTIKTVWMDLSFANWHKGLIIITESNIAYSTARHLGRFEITTTVCFILVGLFRTTKQRMDTQNPFVKNLMNPGQSDQQEGESIEDWGARRKKAIEQLIATNPLFKDYTPQTFQEKMDSHVYRLKCSGCNKYEEPELKLKRCNRCKDAFYCNQECQAKDWPEHKKICYKQDKD